MIRSKKELDFYIQADRMMNRGVFKLTLVQKIKDFFLPDPIMRYLETMRKLSYYCNKNAPPKIYRWWYWRKFNKLGMQLGFSIGHSVFGYGLVIPHWGTIVAGSPNTIGNYAVLHTSTCITANDKKIGNALYVSTGAKITSKLELGDNITVAANSVVNKSFFEGNALLAGAPAVIKRKEVAWFEKESSIFKKRVEAVEDLKRRMAL